MKKFEFSIDGKTDLKQLFEDAFVYELSVGEIIRGIERIVNAEMENGKSQNT